VIEPRLHLVQAELFEVISVVSKGETKVGIKNTISDRYWKAHDTTETLGESFLYTVGALDNHATFNNLADTSEGIGELSLSLCERELFTEARPCSQGNSRNSHVIVL